MEQPELSVTLMTRIGNAPSVPLGLRKTVLKVEFSPLSVRPYVADSLGSRFKELTQPITAESIWSEI